MTDLLQFPVCNLTLEVECVALYNPQFSPHVTIHAKVCSIYLKSNMALAAILDL